MTKKEALKIVKEFKKLKFKCIVPNFVLEAIAMLTPEKK